MTTQQLSFLKDPLKKTRKQTRCAPLSPPPPCLPCSEIRMLACSEIRTLELQNIACRNLIIVVYSMARTQSCTPRVHRASYFSVSCLLCSHTCTSGSSVLADMPTIFCRLGLLASNDPDLSCFRHLLVNSGPSMTSGTKNHAEKMTRIQTRYDEDDDNDAKKKWLRILGKNTNTQKRR